MRGGAPKHSGQTTTRNATHGRQKSKVGVTTQILDTALLVMEEQHPEVRIARRRTAKASRTINDAAVIVTQAGSSFFIKDVDYESGRIRDSLFGNEEKDERWQALLHVSGHRCFLP